MSTGILLMDTLLLKINPYMYVVASWESMEIEPVLIPNKAVLYTCAECMFVQSVTMPPFLMGCPCTLLGTVCMGTTHTEACLVKPNLPLEPLIGRSLTCTSQI